MHKHTTAGAMNKEIDKSKILKIILKFKKIYWSFPEQVLRKF